MKVYIVLKLGKYYSDTVFLKMFLESLINLLWSAQLVILTDKSSIEPLELSLLLPGA